MKKIYFIIILTFIVKINLHSQTKYNLPVNTKASISITIPEKNWTVENNKEFTMISPKGEGEASRLAIFIWGSTNPTKENAIEDLTEEAFELISSVLTETVWDEEVTEFDNNGVSFVAMDGYGYFVNDDNSKDKMSCSVFLIMPDKLNLITLVYFGTNASHDKWQNELTQIILSTNPIK